MAQTAANLVDLPHVPVRQWVPSPPIPLRLRADRSRGRRSPSGAVTLIQRLGSAVANLNIHLNCLVMDGVYRRGAEGEPVFGEVPAHSDEKLQAVLHKIITRIMKLLTRRGVLIEEQGQTYVCHARFSPSFDSSCRE